MISTSVFLKSFLTDILHCIAIFTHILILKHIQHFFFRISVYNNSAGCYSSNLNRLLNFRKTYIIFTFKSIIYKKDYVKIAVKKILQIGVHFINKKINDNY